MIVYLQQVCYIDVSLKFAGTRCPGALEDVLSTDIARRDFWEPGRLKKNSVLISSPNLDVAPNLSDLGPVPKRI